MTRWLWSCAWILLAAFFAVTGGHGGAIAAIGCAVCALLARPQRPLQRYVARDQRNHNVARELVGWFGLPLGFAVMMVLYLVNDSWIYREVTVGLLIAAAIYLELPLLESTAHHRALARGAVINGTVRNQLARITEMSYSYGYGGGDKVEGTRVEGEGPLLIDTATGPVEVVTGDLMWASADVVNTRTVGSTQFQIIERIPVGGRVAATGTILLATGPDGDPQRLAAILARDRHITQLGLVVAGVALVATHLVF